MTKTRVAIIKEEFIELTGNYKLAIVLNQMIYWSERVKDFDLFIAEEQQRLATEGNTATLELQNGWIYKNAADLCEECMITSSDATMRRYLEELVKKGWLDARRNPKYRWDKTLQYRVNLKKIQQDLLGKGFYLDGYKIDLNMVNQQNDASNFQNENTEFQNENSNYQNETTNFQNDNPNFHCERAIPEITTKITSETINNNIIIDEKLERKKVIQFFESNGFGTIGGYISEKINYWCDDLSPELVLEAMKRAVDNGTKKFKYCETILRNWLDKNLKTLAEVNAEDLAFQEQRSKQRKNQQGYREHHQREEVVPEWLNQHNQSKNDNAHVSEEDQQRFADLQARLKEKYKK